MFSKKKFYENHGKGINLLVGVIGGALILVGILIIKCAVVSTVLLSIGTSMVATAIVTRINSAYMLKTQDMENLISIWQLHNIYETKNDMNTRDANDALEQCTQSIDIIGEGLSSYIAAKGDLLKDKITDHNVKVRIISCDSEEMLKQRFCDELGDTAGDDSAVQKVIKLDEWVEKIQKELGINKDNIQIRYHSSYPGFSYLKIDSMVFVSVNLLQKPSQQSFAISFTAGGKGGLYFIQYFHNLWNNSDFVHKECRLRKKDPNFTQTNLQQAPPN